MLSSPIRSWPKEMKMVFWQKPIGDKDTFKLTLFLLGNGCSLNLVWKWILLSQSWAPEKAEKRARQLDFVMNNADQKRSTWFYHNIGYNKLLYLNGLPNNEVKPLHLENKKERKKHKKKQKNNNPSTRKREKKGSFRSHQMYKSQ